MVPTTMPAARKLLIVAAGTGGHVMPGLAIAQALRSKGWVVTWLGTRTGMERSLVERAGLEFHALAFANFRGKGVTALVQQTVIGPAHRRTQMSLTATREQLPGHF